MVLVMLVVDMVKILEIFLEINFTSHPQYSRQVLAKLIS